MHPRLERMKAEERSHVRIVVAMSGGVDSSVAAALLKGQGFEVIGMALKTYDSASGPASRAKSCCSLDDMEDARRVANKLKIPFYVIDTREEFQAKVIDPFIHRYLEGRTPNPCINCNTFIKFDLLMQKAFELGADFVATGHYAHIGYAADDERVHLMRPRDLQKDQTYFMYNLTQEQLRKVLLPLGVLSKEDVRKMAVSLDLPVVAEKPESQEICFVENNNYVSFIEKRVAPDLLPKGKIMYRGQAVGFHEGLHKYTIGQRKGLPQLTTTDIVYVSQIDPEHNVITVANEESLFKNALHAVGMNWINPPMLSDVREFHVKIRYSSQLIPALIHVLADNQVLIRLKDPQRAITPGQGLCVYDNDEVMGGGWIEKAYYLKQEDGDFSLSTIGTDPETSSPSLNQ